MENRKLIYLIELLWWLITAVIVYVLLLPVPGAFSGFAFLFQSVLFIAVFITLARYIFLLHLTPIKNNKPVKVVLIFLSVPFIFMLIQFLNNFFIFVDDYGREALLSHVSISSYQEVQRTGRYIQTIIVFFGTGSVIAAILLPIRMVISLYKQIKYGPKAKN
jgi:hypothetical protein